MRVANLNMTDPNQLCPENLQLSYTSFIQVCGRSSNGNSCDSVTFTTYGVQYRQVCGRVRGYQFGSPDAFDEVHGNCPAPCTSNNYADGVSITHGSPRNHIWTYAAGVVEDTSISATCPCNGGTPPPAFVGSDYYCELGVNTGPWDFILSSLLEHF